MIEEKWDYVIDKNTLKVFEVTKDQIKILFREEIRPTLDKAGIPHLDRYLSKDPLNEEDVRFRSVIAVHVSMIEVKNETN